MFLYMLQVTDHLHPLIAIFTCQERPWSLHVGRCSPERAESALQGAGMVTRQGDIISFVADDLHNKIKLSSPVSKSQRLD